MTQLDSIAPTTATCQRCGNVRDISRFAIARKNGKVYHKHTCKDCENERKREKYRDNPEPYLMRSRSWVLANSEKHKDGIRRYQEVNRSKQQDYKRRYYANNRDRHRDKFLQNTYGISLTDYTILAEQQGHCCAICGEPESRKHSKTGDTMRLVVDHCHFSGVVRKLLCSRCNLVIGKCGDDPSLLEKMMVYLRTHGASIGT